MTETRVELKHCENCGQLFCRSDKQVYCRRCASRLERAESRPDTRAWHPPTAEQVWKQGMQTHG